MSNWPEGGAGAMLKLVASLPEQLRGSARLEGLAGVSPVAGLRRAVLCGMGGSAIAGDLVQPLLDSGTTSLEVWRDYGLPHWAGAADLVIAASYSGHTEETLAGYAAAAARGCPRLAITSGGELLARACRRAADPRRGRAGGARAPRRGACHRAAGRPAAAGQPGLGPRGPGPCAGAPGPGGERALRRGDGRGRARPCRRAASDPDGNPPAAELAAKLAGRVPVIYTCGGESHAAGLRLKAQLNENSKVPALLAAFPELDHNDLVGWCLDPGERQRFVLLVLRAGDEHPRTSLRVGLTLELLADQFAGVFELRGGGGDALARVMSLVQYGDYLSCHLAGLRGVDPVPVDRIVRLKDALARAQNP